MLQTTRLNILPCTTSIYKSVFCLGGKTFIKSINGVRKMLCHPNKTHSCIWKWCTGEYLIVWFVASQGSHDCRFTTVCTTETHRYLWVRTHGRLSPPFLLAKPRTSKANKFLSVMALKEVYSFKYWLVWMHAFQLVLSQYVHKMATYSCHDARGCVMQFWSDNVHMCSKYVEAWNKLIVKLKCYASSSLITEINVLRCRTVS